MSEQIEVLDQHGNVLEVMDRTEAETNDLVLPNVIVFIFNTKGQVWLGKRPEWKKQYPNRWDPTACGGLLPNEDPMIGALRELKEEAGIKADLKHAKTFLNVFPDDSGEGTRRRFSHVFVGFSEEVLKANKEVAEYRLFTPDEVKLEIAKTPELFVPPMQVELNYAMAVL